MQINKIEIEGNVKYYNSTKLHITYDEYISFYMKRVQYCCTAYKTPFIVAVAMFFVASVVHEAFSLFQSISVWHLNA